MRPQLKHTLVFLVLLLPTLTTSTPPKYKQQRNIKRRSASPLQQQIQDPSSNDLPTDLTKMCTLSSPNSTNNTRGPTPGGCIKLELDMKRFSLELIKQDILKKLRIDGNKMPTKGNFTYDPSYLSRFVDMQGDSPVSKDEWFDDEHATTPKIISFSKPETAVIEGKQVKNLYQFSFSEKMSNMNIESAIMYIHVHHQHHHGGFSSDGGKKGVVNIRIREPLGTVREGDSHIWVTYGTFKPKALTSNQEGGASTQSGSSSNKQRHSKWMQIDISDLLSKWVMTSNGGNEVGGSGRKTRLVIEAVDGNGNPSSDFVVVSSLDGKNNNNPFVEVRVSDASRSRQPRNIALTCNENSKETRCCKYPLTVDFEEFGWDWIIAPKKYDANYCSGECPYAFLQTFPHNHIVQQANPSGVGGPCCAARKHSAISMLYFDGDSNIVFSVLPGMVVEKCGCS